MSAQARKIRIGFIPLVDAAALMVASEFGFWADEGLDIELVREVSWSNVRDKLNIGLLDAAHLLAPVTIASTLGLGHVQVPLVAPFCLNLNGNAITVSPGLRDDLQRHATGDLDLPANSALALAEVVRARSRSGAPAITFGMTFPYSTHNYQLRYWMAEGGIDPDEDVRLVVLPPPFMVESLASGQVDGFCVGAPWNSVAVDEGIGHILHFGTDIVSPVAEKVFAMRESWATANPDLVSRLVRGAAKAAEVVADPSRQREVAELLARPDRIAAKPDLIAAALAGRLKVTPSGAVREDASYIVAGGRLDGAAHANRPDPLLAAWLYGQMVRWRQVGFDEQLLTRAQSVFRPDLYDAAFGRGAPPGGMRDVKSFAGPVFSPGSVRSCIQAWTNGARA